MSIRVFISHSTWLKEELDERLRAQVPGHTAFLKLLCDRLTQMQDPRIEVAIDSRIPAGRIWREFLFDEMGECQAAIILVNEQALHHSPWVHSEVTVLGYRAFNERSDFRLIVVPFGGVTAADIADKVEWRPIPLTELQIDPRGGLDERDQAAVEDLITKISAALRELPASTGRSPSGWLVTRLCNLLPGELSVLKSIAETLNVSCVGATSPTAIRRTIARFLYENGPLSMLKLLKCPALPQHWDRYAVLEILGTYWVDLQASIGILSCSRDAACRRAVAINAKYIRYTPQIYVRQVCGEQVAWPVIDIDASRHPAPEQIRKALLDDVRFNRPLKRLLGGIEYATEDNIDQALNNLMSRENAAPVFVTFLQEGGGNVDDIIDDIRSTYPHINIIICTGTKFGAAPVVPPEVIMLTPLLDLEREAKELMDYGRVETHWGLSL